MNRSPILALAFAGALAAAACGDGLTEPSTSDASNRAVETTSEASGPVTLSAIDVNLIITISGDPDDEYPPAGQQTNGLAPSFDAALPAAHPGGETLQRTFVIDGCNFGGCTGKVEFGDGSAPQNLTITTGSAWDPIDETFVEVVKGSFAHTWTTGGDFTVVVAVESGAGSNIQWKTLEVSAPLVPTVVDLTGASGLVGQPVLVYVGATPTPWSGTIAWGDGEETVLPAGADRPVAHTYATTGTYDVVATLQGDGALQGSATTTVAVAKALSLDGPGTPVEQGSEFTVQAVLGAGVTYAQLSVDWGDGKKQGVDDPSGTVPLKHAYGTTGVHTLTVKATTPTGTTFSATLGVEVRNVPPSLSAAVSPTRISQGGTVTVDGSFDDPGADAWNVTIDWGDGSSPSQFAGTPGVPFSVPHVFTRTGRLTIEVSVTDGVATAATTGTVTVINMPPLARIEAPAQVACGANGAIEVSGASSYDRDGEVVAWTWSVGGAQLSTDVAPTLSLPLGSHTLELTVTDDYGLTGTAQTTIEVQDTEAPDITVDQTVSEIFPPNGRMVAVATVRVTDGCDPTASPEITVTANEPLESGDVRLVSRSDGSVSVEVLATRSGQSRDGRIYTVTASASDASGNGGQEQFTVTVLHDNRDKANKKAKDKGRKGGGE